MISEYISSFATLMQVIQQKEGSLVIVAPGYDSNFVDFFRINKQRMVNLMICPITYSSSSKAQKDNIDDLRVFLGIDRGSVFGETGIDDGSFTKFMSRHGDIKKFGKCETALISQNKAIFINGKAVKSEFGSEENNRLLNRRDELSKKLQQIASDDYYINRSEETAEVRKRLLNISENSTAKITVGGNTPQEAHTRFYLVEDAVNACRSALRFGVGFGCNYTVYRAIMSYIIDSKGMKDDDDLDICFDKKTNKFSYYADGFETPMEELSRTVLNAYVASTLRILQTIDGDSANEEINEVITSFDRFKVYNLSTNSVTPEIDLVSRYIKDDYEIKEEEDIPPLNSIETDIEVLRTAVSIITLLLTSKNFISSESLMDNEEGLKTNESMIRR